MLKQAELLGIVFFLSGCATTSIPTLTTAVPSPPLELRSWTPRPDVSMTVPVPGGWRIEGQHFSDTFVMRASSGAHEGLIILRSLETPCSDDDAALKQVGDGMLEQLSEAPVEVLEPLDLIIAGHKARQVGYNSVVKDRPVRGELTVILGQNGLYTVNALGPMVLFGDIQNARDELVRGLRINERPRQAKTYRDPDGQFTTVAPSGWALLEHRSDDLAGRYFHAFGSLEAVNTSVVVARVENPSIRSNDAGLVLDVLESAALVRMGATSHEVVETRTVTLGGREALLRSIRAETPTGKQFVLHVVQTSSDEFTAMSSTGAERDYAEARGAIDIFQRSFRFAEREPRAIASR